MLELHLTPIFLSHIVSQAYGFQMMTKGEMIEKNENKGAQDWIYFVLLLKFPQQSYSFRLSMTP